MRFWIRFGLGWIATVANPTVCATETSVVWKRLEPTSAEPTPRRGVAGVYDAAGRRLVFQGAETRDVRFLRDVWSFDLEGNTWSRFSGSEPDTRCHHTIIMERDRRRALLFGGFPRTNKLWSWDGTTSLWTDITPQKSPTPRCLHSSLSWPERGEMIVYGGLNGGFSPDLPDTWSYDLAANSWTLLVADSAPGRRYGHVVALDEARGRMILFGGFRRPPSGGLRNANDLWAFDRTSKIWTELFPATSGPSPRQFARGATLRDGSGLILFGGLSDAGPMSDLWVLKFEDLSWTQLTPEGPHPPARFRHTLVLDATGHRLWVAFGEGESREHFSDIWTLELEPPATRQAPFRRGDTNADGEVDISDAVTTLFILFLGDGQFPCEDAGDSNDDGQVDISDAIGVLSFLFLGNALIPDPGQDGCGMDPTEDGLTCDLSAACE